MKLALRSSLLTLAVILFTFGSAHSEGWSLFKMGGKGRTVARPRYSIVEEYKEAYRPVGRGWYGKNKMSATRSKHVRTQPRRPRW